MVVGVLVGVAVGIAEKVKRFGVTKRLWQKFSVINILIRRNLPVGSAVGVAVGAA